MALVVIAHDPTEQRKADWLEVLLNWELSSLIGPPRGISHLLTMLLLEDPEEVMG